MHRQKVCIFTLFIPLALFSYATETRGLKNLKVLGFSRCNEGTIGDGAVSNPYSTGSNVKETISILKFPQVQGSLQLERKVALDQVAYEIDLVQPFLRAEVSLEFAEISIREWFLLRYSLWIRIIHSFVTDCTVIAPTQT